MSRPSAAQQDPIADHKPNPPTNSRLRKPTSLPSAVLFQSDNHHQVLL